MRQKIFLFDGKNAQAILEMRAAPDEGSFRSDFGILEPGTDAVLSKPCGPNGLERQRGRGYRAVPLALVAALGVIAVLVSATSPVHGLTLEEANDRWAGAACTLQIPLEFKKKPDKDGWLATRHIVVPGPYTVHPITKKVRCSSCAKGELPFAYMLRVSDRNALAGLLRGREIPAGTEFIVRSWRALSQERGFILELEFRDAPVTARFYFAMTPKDLKEGMNWDRLAQMEQFMRIQIFRLIAADEGLETMIEAPVTAETRLAAPANPEPVSASANYRPEVEVESVSVNPPKFSAGAEIEFVVTFTLAGLPPGATFEVTVQHEIWQDQILIATLPEQVGYAVGIHTNSRTVRSDPGQSPGLYTLRTTVTFVGIAATQSALFIVE